MWRGSHDRLDSAHRSTDTKKELLCEKNTVQAALHFWDMVFDAYSVNTGRYTSRHFSGHAKAVGAVSNF